MKLITYILFSGSQYYPLGGAEDKTTILRAADDQAALDQLPEIPGDRLDEWWQLAKIDDDKLVPVRLGYVDGIDDCISDRGWLPDAV